MPRSTFTQLDLFQADPPKSTSTIKCLFLKQAYAYALFHGKDIENRTWRVNHRGLVLIGASKFDADYYQESVSVCMERGLLVPSPDLLPFGAITGVVDLVSITWGHESKGWGFANQWHWHVTNARQFREPIKYRGMPGLFDVPMTLQEVNELCS